MKQRAYLTVGLATTLLLSAALPVTAAPFAQGQLRYSQQNIDPQWLNAKAQEIYFWAWPMVNVYNRRLSFSALPGAGLLGGSTPVAPANQLAMLTDYIDPIQRLVACPNQDMVYGFATLALDLSPMVIQVPDFGSRYWLYQLVDVRTESFASLSKSDATKPGFYLIVGPDWKGKKPQGITQVIHAPGNTAVFIPRIFQNDTRQDNNSVQPLLSRIALYPLAEFTGKFQERDWSKLPVYPLPKTTGEGEAPQVDPETFWATLGKVLNDTPPRPGEAYIYAQARRLVTLAEEDPGYKALLVQAAKQAEQRLISPLISFSSFGIQLPHYWTAVSNGANYGDDSYTRTAVARSNIFVNTPTQTQYFYQEHDSKGNTLTGGKNYTLTFAKGKFPPVKGFWSLTMYNNYHFFVENGLKRYSLGTKNPQLKYNADGSLTFYIQSTSPGAAKATNWLPAPTSGPFVLYLRAYWPDEAILKQSWTPPEVKEVSP